MYNRTQFLSFILAGTILGAGITAATPAFAQNGGSAAGTGDDIIVTARRTAERLQDVPISITVLNQQELSNRNIVSATDLGSYVPSLSVNQQFGPAKASFVIRGFTQEGKTSPSVGVFFADVVAPRSFGGTTSGNGAGVGSMFDLQNVQVLKGPQGTLFGRNTTGGDILLVPTKPTDKLEGYVEGSLGNFNMHRIQAVLNIPLSDTFRVRGGIDWNQSDGYVHNKSGIGPKDFNNTNYFAARLSIDGDLTPDLENYMIFRYSRSNTNGNVPAVRTCGDTSGFALSDPSNPSYAFYKAYTPLAFVLNPFACEQVARQKARGDGFYDVENNNPDPFERVELWQAINTTTWTASDTLTVKNIISYAQYREAASFSLEGDNFVASGGEPLLLSLLSPYLPNLVATPGQTFTTIQLHPGFSGYNSQQSTFTEEFQLHGSTSDGRLDWQAGLYFELSKPLGFNAGLTDIFLNCSNINTFTCTNPLFIGSISDSQVKDTFNNKAAYAQVNYKITDKFTLTGGIRYTIDKMSDLSENLNIHVPVSGTPVFSCQNQILFPGGAAVTDPTKCAVPTNKTWKRPTWLINLQYKPIEDLMVYAKYSRGYRQGSINSNNLGLEVVGPEKVDAYEAGAKASFHGAVPGYFNIAAFYNKFRDQQLAVNTVVAPAFSGIVSPSQPIVNAGTSRIWGVEVEAAVSPFQGFKAEVDYTYLNTKLVSFTPPPTPIYYSVLLPTADVGQPLALSPKNRVSITGTYTLPLDESVGQISFGATFTHTDSNRAVSPAASPSFYLVKASNLLNLNARWNSVMGSPFDVSFFMSNATNEKRYTYPLVALTTIGAEGGQLNMPRMWGFRLRYHFGD